MRWPDFPRKGENARIGGIVYNKILVIIIKVSHIITLHTIDTSPLECVDLE